MRTTPAAPSKSSQSRDDFDGPPSTQSVPPRHLNPRSRLDHPPTTPTGSRKAGRLRHDTISGLGLCHLPSATNRVAKIIFMIRTGGISPTLFYACVGICIYILIGLWIFVHYKRHKTTKHVRHGRCVNCGYSMHGITGTRCPECGKSARPEKSHAD
jgi:hypothetical protein